jgi:hypothetical protein
VGQTTNITCYVRRHRHFTHVHCVTVEVAATRAVSWRLSRSGHTVAHGLALPHKGRVAVHLGSIRPRLRAGRYTLTLGQGRATVHRRVIVRAR